MNQPVISNCSAGPIRALHGVNCAPYSRSSQNDQRLITRVFREGGIPYSRLHDCCGMWGGSCFVDVPNVFRNFEADVNDPASYDFHYGVPRHRVAPEQMEFHGQGGLRGDGDAAG